MQPGQRVLGRFVLEERQSADDDQLRWSARDEVSGEPVEVVAPAGRVALRPGAAACFARASELAATDDAPALLPPLAHGTEDGRPLAARPRTRGPIDTPLRLDPDQALAWANWLAPAVLAADGALGGELSPRDLVVDADGVLRLAPAGLVPARSEVHPPRHRAPEVLAGNAPQPGSSLYGLGVMLFSALSGAWPVDATTAAALRNYALETGRPARSLASARPDLDPGVVAVVDGLLDRDPDRRLATARALGAGAPVQARAHASPAATPATASTGPPGVKTTRLAPPPGRARIDRQPAAWLVTADAGALTDAARTRAAALLGVPPATVDELADRELPVPLDEAPTEAAAAKRATALSDQGLPTRVDRGGAPAAPAAAAVAEGVGAGMLAAVAALALLLAGTVGGLALPVAAVLGLLAVLLTTLSVVSAREALRRRRLVTAQGLVDTAPPPGEADPVARLGNALQGVRADILRSELPTVVRVDLEGAADEIDAQLLELRTAWAQPVLHDDVRAAIDRLAPLVDMLREAVSAQVRLPEPDEHLREEVRRRAQAARATTRGSR